MVTYKPSVSILIRTKNEERFIGQTLSAIFDQEFELPLEVIVIDSGSTDRTIEIVREFNVRLYEIESDKFSFGFALNYGAELAMGEFIVNLSAHCIPVDSKWLDNLLAPLLSDPSVAATYGNQVPITGLNPFEERSLIANFGYNGEAHFSNANSAIRKMIWKEHPFDEKAVFAEDYIWSKLLPSKHKVKYVPDAAVYHSHPLTLRYWTKRYYYTGLVTQYMEHVYGLKYPLQKRNYKGKCAITKNILRTAWDYFVFLPTHNYLLYIPIFPMFFILKYLYIYKGVKQGKRLYGPSKCQA